MGGFDIKLRELLENEEEKLQKIRDKIAKNLDDTPKGSLRLGKSQGCVQYYYCDEENRIYIPKTEMDTVRKLAQKTYDEKVLKCVDKRLNQFKRILKDYEDDEIEKLYLREHPERRKLVIPIESTRQQKLEKWMSEPYTGLGFQEDSSVILSNNGLRVRSKSEKIMADYFDSKGIQYKYECPLELSSYGIIYPDFTFLSPHTGEIIYWEHEGMMDKPEYARTAVKKIELYEKSGIYPGENLILTFETSVSAINMNLIKELTEKYLLEKEQ